METAGLAVGVGSAAALLTAFFDGVERIKQMKGVRSDVREAITRLRVEKERLSRIQEKYDINRLGSSERLFTLVLQQILHEFEKIDKTISKYGQKTQAHQVIPARNLKKLSWVTGDKADVDRRLLTLHDWMESLLRMAEESESERRANDYLVRSRIVLAFDHEDLERLGESDSDLYRDISKAARVKSLLEYNTKADKTGPAQQGVKEPTHLIPFESIQWQRISDSKGSTKGQWSLGKCRPPSKGTSEIPILVEWRNAFEDGGQPQGATKTRLENMYELLHAMYTTDKSAEGSRSDSEPKREVEFGVFESLGWTRTTASHQRLGFIFRLPTSQLRPPEPLNEAMERDRRRRYVPALGYRFDMAFGVASAIANIIAVGWVHRAVRSENMLTVNGQGSRLFLIGFTYSRANNPAQEFSNLPANPEWELYRPAKSTSPGDNSLDGPDEDAKGSEEDISSELSASNPVAVDMYGLGIVLIEIGLWKPAKTLVKEATWEICLTQMLPRCGAIYCEVVRRCLDVPYWDSSSLDEKLADLLAQLKSCHA